jgi:hypothetical protein
MRSHFRLRRRDTRWLMFPVLVVLCGLLAIGIVVFTPGSETAVAEPVLAMRADLQPLPQLSDPAEQPDR